jgi:hypothetical protein
MPKAAADVPLDHALEQTKTKRKMWRDLVEAKVQDPARRAGKKYVISGQQYDRLKRIHAIRSRVDGRVTIGKITFELAIDGDRSVPVSLLRKELQKRVDSYLGFVRRTCQRHFGLSPKISHVTESEVYAAAKKFANRLTKRMPLGKRVAAFPACWLFMSMFLRMMYLRKPNPLDHVRGIKELLILTGSIDHPTKGHVGFPFSKAVELARQFAATLSGLWLVFSLDKSVNILYKAPHDGTEDDFWKAFNATENVRAALWGFYGELGRDIKLPSFTALERAKLDPLILATIIAYQTNPPKDAEFLNEILAGSDRKLRGLLSQLLVAVRAFLRLQPLLEPFRRK